MTVAKDQKMNILLDPVTLFASNCPDAEQGRIKSLTTLHQQYVELKTRLKITKDQNKKTSRQIGEAKRGGLPAEELMQSMREQSSNINKLKAQLNDCTDDILSFFEPDSSSEEKSNDELSRHTPVLPPARIYTDQSAAGEQISITLLNGENKDWNNYVRDNPATSLYHRLEWKDLIHNTFGHTSYYFYASNDDGEIVGILPLVRLKSKLFGDFMVSMPYFNYGGAIANSPSIEQKLIETANDHAKETGVNHIEYRDNIAHEYLDVHTEKVNMTLPLPDTHEALWQTFSSKLRSQVRRSQREEARVVFGGEESLGDFYTVFARNMRDLGTPVYGKPFFRKILQTFPKHSKIVVVYLADRPVAGAFLLGDKNRLEIPWASTIKRVNHLSLNMLLYWEVLKFAIENNYLHFDFGRSSKDSGTFRFKHQWGARPEQQYWHYWLSENAELPGLNPSNPKYRLAISIWKRLPINITKWLGPRLVKNLP